MSVKDLDYRAGCGRGNQTASTRMPSELVWRECPYFQLQQGVKDGFAYWDDFLGNYIQAANVAAASTTVAQPWAAFTDATAGNTLASGIAPTDAVGSLVFNSTTTQEGSIIQLHSALNTAAHINALSATNRLWLEGRFKVSTITTEEIALFFGLGIVGRAITLGMIATGGAASAAVDNLGFLYKAAATTAISTVYGNSNANTLAATGVIAADTYTKLGLYWNGATVTFYQDGVALADTLALATSNFPAGANLALYLSMMDGTGASTNTAACDWVKIAFERTSTSTT